MERDGERRGGEERVKAVSSINLNPSICRGAPHLIGSARRDLINLTRPAHTHTTHTHHQHTHTHTTSTKDRHTHTHIKCVSGHYCCLWCLYLKRAAEQSRWIYCPRKKRDHYTHHHPHTHTHT